MEPRRTLDMKRVVPGLAAVCILLAYCGLYVFQGKHFADDPGVGWHFKTGELILSRGNVPREDPFLAAATQPSFGLEVGMQRRWVCDQWLSDLALYAIRSIGGYPLVFAFSAGLFIVAFFAVLAPVARAQARSTLVVLLVSMLGFRLAQVHFLLRPVLFSILLFAVVYREAIAIAAQEELSGGACVRRGARLAGVFLVWANLHPAFVEGLLLIALIVPGLALEGRLSREKCVRIALLLFVCCTATLVNPNGLELHRSIVELGSDRYLMSLNNEWRPLYERVPVMGFESASFILVCGVPLVLGWRQRHALRAGWGVEMCATAVCGLQALSMVRCLPFAALAAIPLAAQTYSSALATVRFPPVWNLSRAFFSTIERSESARKGWGATACMCSVGGIALTLLLSHKIPKEWFEPSGQRYDQKMIQAIRASSDAGVILATPDLGGFITETLYPHFRAVIDDRNTLIGAQFYREYFESEHSSAERDTFVKSFSVTHIITPRTSDLAGKEDECDALYVGEQWVVCSVSPARRGQL